MNRQPDKAFLLHLADLADAESLSRFRRRIDVDNKLEGAFDPVTEADRAVERAIRGAIGERFADHAVLGEEYGHQGSGDSLWVIDPIDGTRAFISGVPVWGTLIGYCEGGVAGLGVMSQAFTGERYLADSTGSYLQHGGGETRLRVRKTTALDDAILFTTTPRMFKGTALERFEELEGRVQLTRFGTDCYAFCMLAAGHIDLVVETGLNPYDIVALIPIIEQAGGVVTTYSGDRAEAGGDVVAAATPELHAAALAILNG